MIIDKGYNRFTDRSLFMGYTIHEDIMCDENLDIILDKPLIVYGLLCVKGNLTSNVPIHTVGIRVDGNMCGRSIFSNIQYCEDVKLHKFANIEIGGNISAESIDCEKLTVKGNICVKKDLFARSVKAKNVSVGGTIETFHAVETDGDISVGYLNVHVINAGGSITAQTNIHCYTEISAGSYIDCGGEIVTGAFCDTNEPYIDPTIYNIKCSELRNGKIVRGNLVLI